MLKTLTEKPLYSEKRDFLLSQFCVALKNCHIFLNVYCFAVTSSYFEKGKRGGNLAWIVWNSPPLTNVLIHFLDCTMFIVHALCMYYITCHLQIECSLV